MKFFETDLKDSFIIEIEKVEDERGFFARQWDTKILKEMHLDHEFIQCNISFNKKKGTIRGLHFQKSPYEETKIIRCSKGKIFDIIVDLRIKSNTYKKWFGLELSESNYKLLYVPKGFAHGFQTLEDNSEVSYNVSQFHAPNYEAGVRWNDPQLKIVWPLEPTLISQKDRNWELLKNE